MTCVDSSLITEKTSVFFKIGVWGRDPKALRDGSQSFVTILLLKISDQNKYEQLLDQFEIIKWQIGKSHYLIFLLITQGMQIEHFICL